MYLAGTGAAMEAGLVAQAETAAIAVPSGLAGATELLASTTACERLAATIRTCVMTSVQPTVSCPYDCALPAVITPRDVIGRGRPGRTHGWSRPIQPKVTSSERL